ncbi:MAG: ornithine carbamoyltransferase [Clostridiales bacterium]|nr:ornithine carbamoyltransferase [Clostridiales bacterium]
MKHLLGLYHLSKEEILEIFKLAEKLKYETKNGIKHHLLKGKTLAMIFAKSSTRTRVSFETGMYQLGGHPLFLSSNDIQLGRGESIEDTAKVLSRYVDGIMIRTFKQSDVEDLAKFGSIPVINALTDLLHPCQVLADIFTIYEEFGTLTGKKLAYVGDGNNMANSLLYGCSKVGIDVSIATPKGYEPNKEVIAKSLEFAEESGCTVSIGHNPSETVKGASAVYTDTWVSMGMEEEKERRINDFKGFIVSEQLMQNAAEGAIFLHCLPGYRGFEVSAEVMDGSASRIFDEAENRLHVQKAVMVKLMGDK